MRSVETLVAQVEAASHHRLPLVTTRLQSIQALDVVAMQVSERLLGFKARDEQRDE